MFRLSIESSHPEQDFDMFPDNVFSATVWIIPLISIFFVLSDVVSFRFETILLFRNLKRVVLYGAMAYGLVVKTLM